MLCRTVALAILILCLSIHGSKGRKRNATWKSGEPGAGNEEESSFSISPSFSYQYHTNDHGDFDLEGTSGVGTTAEPQVPDSSLNSTNDSASQRSQEDRIAKAQSNRNYEAPPNPQPPQYYADQSDSYAPPAQINAYNPSPIDNSYGNPTNNDYQVNPAPSLTYGFVPNPTPNDNYYAPSPVPISEGYYNQPSDSYYAPDPAPVENYGYPAEPAPVPAETAPIQYAQSKGYGYGYGQGGGFDGGGNGGFGGGGAGGGGGGEPLPPPPSIKGSIDYVLIPLILIGIAGPIFVVLYVVLGAFEAKLSPIVATRSIQSWNDVFTDSYRILQPATELLFKSIDNGLIYHFECMDQVICQVGSFGHDLGLEKLGYLETFVGSFGLEEKEKRQVETLFSTLRSKPKSCFSIQCHNNKTKKIKKEQNRGSSGQKRSSKRNNLPSSLLL